MNTTTLRRHAALLAVTGLAATGLAAGLTAAPAQAAEAELDATMHTTATQPNVRGHAEYDNEASGREFEISLAGIKGLNGHRVIVRVHGDLVGKMTVNQQGRAHLDKHSGVPSMAAGNVVRVRTGSGALVTYGSLHRSVDN